MIPPMDDPLGKYWEQPRDIREAPMDEALVLLTPAQFSGLHDYSTTTPTGVYPGKCWKRQGFTRDPKTGAFRWTGEWFLRWYGECDDPKMCSNHQRQIEVVT